MKKNKLMLLTGICVMSLSMGMMTGCGSKKTEAPAEVQTEATETEQTTETEEVEMTEEVEATEAVPETEETEVV